MYYEIYIDSIFLVNFTMNLYVLLLTNQRCGYLAPRVRIFGAALLGALGFCLSFLLPNNLPFIKYFSSFVGTGILMGYVAFRIRGGVNYIKVFSIMLLYTFLIGGFLIFIMRMLPWLHKKSIGIFSLMCVGGIFWMVVSYIVEKNEKKKTQICEVTIKHKGKVGKVNALIDTGNSLIEPISGKAVCVIEKEILFSFLDKEDLELFRVIPYSSVGKEKGILKAYEITELSILRQGVIKSQKGVYVAVSDLKLSAKKNYRMILHPKLIEG